MPVHGDGMSILHIRRLMQGRRRTCGTRFTHGVPAMGRLVSIHDDPDPTASSKEVPRELEEAEEAGEQLSLAKG